MALSDSLRKYRLAIHGSVDIVLIHIAIPWRQRSGKRAAGSSGWFRKLLQMTPLPRTTYSVRDEKVGCLLSTLTLDTAYDSTQFGL